MTAIDSTLITTTSVREYFHDTLTAAARNQDVDLGEATTAYVINLLTAYSHATALVPVSDEGQHHKPLALIYAEAIEAGSDEQRNQALQRLGDLALFIAGIFTDSLNRKLVDVDYYIGMGESDGNEGKVAIPTPVSGIIGGLQVRTNVASGTGTRGFTFTVYVNGSATGVTCSISGPSEQNCSDTGNSVAVSAGDRITLRSSPNGNPAAVSVTWSYYIDQ